MVTQDKITLRSKGHRDIHNLTEAITAIVERSGVQTGMAHVFNVGSTAAIGTIEFEPGLGPSLVIPISDGKLVLGTWQQVFHLECDVRPRERAVVVTVYGER